MRKAYQTWFLGVVFTVLPVAALAQKVLYPEINPINQRFDNFLIKGGAADQASTSIIFDNKGFLWSGTQNGLYRFDGTEYIEYLKSENDSSGYSSNYILTLFEDSEGYIWVGTIGALIRLDPATGLFRHYYPDTSEDPPVNNIIKLIREDTENNLLWIITNGNIFSFDKSTAEFTEYEIHPSAWLNETNILREPNNTFLVDRDSNSWFATQYGLYCFRNKEKRFVSVFPDTTVKWETENAYIACICEDSEGTIWLGTGGGNLLRLRSGDEKPQKIDFTAGLDKPEGFYTINTVKHDKSGRLWIFGDNVFSVFDPSDNTSVIYQIRFGRNEIVKPGQRIRIHQAYFMPDSTVWFFSHASGIMYRFDPRIEKLTFYRVPNYIVFKTEIDQTGAFWFAAVRNNLHRLTIKNVPFISLPINNEAGVGAASIGKVSSDHTGNILAITTGGLIRFRIDDDFSNPGLEYINNIGGDTTFASMFRDSRMRMWFGGKTGQVLCKYPGTDRIVRYQLSHPYLKTESDAIRKILEDNNGNIWAVTVNSGLFMLSDSSGQFSHLLDYSDLPGRITIDPTDFLPSDNGEFWLLTLKGVYRWKLPENTIKSYSNQFNKGKLESEGFSRIKRDPEGNIWLLTCSRGLYLFNREEDSFSHVTLGNDLQGSTFFDLAMDSLNRLWLAGSDRIIVFNPSDGNLRTIKMRMLQFDVQGYPVPGHMVYINAGRIYIFDLDIPVNNTVPDIYLTDLEINGENFNNVIGTDEDVRSLRVINLKHKYNNLKIDFCAINYIDPGSNTYCYFMAGIDNDTVCSGGINYAEYKKLKPGRYTFWVTGANNEGIWNKEGVTLNINIDPPIYNTTLAFIIYFIISVLAIAGYIRLRINKIISENIRLEAVVKERTEELEIKNRQLENSDKIKTKFFTDISHEIRTPLSLILGPLDYLPGEIKMNNKTENLLDIMKRNGNRLMQLVNQMLDISRLDSGKMKLALTESDIILFFRMHVYEFVSLAESKNIRYVVVMPEEPYITFFDEDKLEKIINNLLSNAFKFTEPGGNINCIISIRKGNGAEEPDKIIIKVEDTGEGIAIQNIDRIFDRFYKVERPGDYPKDGTGVGLSLTRELVDLCHGRISVSSEEGRGSVFEVKIPLGKDHLSSDEFVIVKGCQHRFESHETRRLKEIDHYILKEEHEQDPQKYSLLIVEDNNDLRRFIVDNLEKKYRIIDTDNGSTGINLGLTHIPDLVITDIMMKDIDGYMLCERLKNDDRTSHIPVIMLTAKSSGEDRIMGLQHRADDYLVKPFSMAELEARIANLMAQREQLKLKYANILGLRLDKHEKETADERFMRKVISTINENIKDFDFNVRVLQIKLGMSHAHLCRKLKVLTGMSPVVLIRNIRLEKAAALIENKSGNINEVANSVGISNPSYFTRCFREYFGVLPRDYQEGKMLHK